MRAALPRAMGFLRAEGGTAFLEAAIAIPMALVILAGLVDFGRAYSTLATAQKSARTAVRYLTTLPPAAICGWGLTRARNLARFGNVDGTGSPLVSNWTSGQITLTTPSCPATSAAIVRVQADVPFAPIFWPAIGLPSSMTLKVDYQARWTGE